ncbi:hypothetical protein [Bradyrhizobium ottawaense]|uniref:hypothetical protein n=1 Tax=Bradyrhizobium ottawaense TaxID=931866 RepID=UPI00384D87AF
MSARSGIVSAPASTPISTPAKSRTTRASSSREAQAVLGEPRYREIEETYPTALLIATLRALKRDGELHADDVDLLSRMIDAMICKIGLLLPHADDSRKLRRNGQKIVAAVLETFRQKV